MNKLISVTPVYNNDETIFDCLSALDNFVDELIILEGSWIGYNKPVHSTDNTIEEIIWFKQQAKHKVNFMMLDEPIHQYEARNLMINLVNEGDYFIWIDSDEIMRWYPKDVHELLKECTERDLKGIRICGYESPQTMDKASLMDIPRIIRRQNGLLLTENHRYFNYRDGSMLSYNVENYLLSYGFILYHKTEKAFRPEAEEYKKWLSKFENTY